jgi:6-pyruvoyltetrahydropterin/6-carboxytetrahydropterin synthase
VVEVTLGGPVKAATGMIVNLAELDPFVEERVVEAFDSKYLNEEIAEFRQVVPTAENICKEIFRRLKKFRPARVERVRVEETSKNTFEYEGP